MKDFTQLMQAVCANTQGSFDDLMDAHAEEMVNYFHKHCWSRELAEDLSQELFVRLYIRRDQFDGTQSIGKGYMYSIARNLWVDHCRRKARRREITIEEYEVGCCQMDPGEGLLLAEAQEDVRLALQKISKQHREIVLLVAFQKLSYNEVAETLGIAVGTVKSRVHHGLKKMRDLLREKHGTT